MGPTVLAVKRQSGIAGEFGYAVTIQYEGEPAETVQFVGSVYGPPIVMVTPSGIQTFVSERVLDRCGRKLSPEWVRRFFAGEAS